VKICAGLLFDLSQGAFDALQILALNAGGILAVHDVVGSRADFLVDGSGQVDAGLGDLSP
jgi:hypothetical protein